MQSGSTGSTATRQLLDRLDRQGLDSPSTAASTEPRQLDSSTARAQSRIHSRRRRARREPTRNDGRCVSRNTHRETSKPGYDMCGGPRWPGGRCSFGFTERACAPYTHYTRQSARGHQLTTQGGGLGGRAAAGAHTERQNEIPPAATRETTHCNNQEHNDKTTPFLSMSVMALQGDRLLRGAQPAECRKEGPVRPNGRLSFRRASHFSFM